jgi:hypothetical protein
VTLPAGASAAADAPVLLRPQARLWRAALTVVLAGLFLAGTLVGDDHWWPFGPWRMFATATKPGGAIVAMGIEVRTAADDAWQPASLHPTAVGLNRAEVEGRIPQIVADPSRLGTLAAAHARLRPAEPPWTAVRLVRRDAVLDGREPTGETRTTVVAEWAASR